MTWTCYSTDGANGAGSSNLALGLYGVEAIDAFMTDPGPNSAAGHRRWILFPPRAAMATGDTPGDVSHMAANALYVFGPSTARPFTPDGVAWPPADFVPYQNLPSASNRWSFSFPSAAFTNATVTVTGPSGPLPVTFEPLATGFGDNTIVFLPTGVTYTRPMGDTTYTITVSSMSGAGVPPSIQYTVTVIDPAMAGPAPASTIAVVEFYNASLDHYFISIDTQEIHDLDTGLHAGWARTGLSFKAYPGVTAGVSPVCRFYIPLGYGDSHFFSASPQECNETHAKFPQLDYEAPNVFYITLPDTLTGTCPAGTIPVYRLWNQRSDSNHRYTTDPVVKAQMLSRGYVAEGYGTNAIIMCAPQ